MFCTVTLNHIALSIALHKTGINALYSTLHYITHENMFCTLFTKITTIKKYFGLVEPQLENEGGGRINYEVDFKKRLNIKGRR